MHGMLEFLFHHGYLVLLVWVFAEQGGVPIPSTPLLLAAGALAGAGRMNFIEALLTCLVAALAADTIWYQLGRRKGIKVLQLICRISLEPDSCVRRTEGLFEKRGARTLLFAKFVPGLNTVATPLARAKGSIRLVGPNFLRSGGCENCVSGCRVFATDKCRRGH